MKPVSEFMHV